MARLVAVCRDGEEEFPFEKRQIPLYIDDTLTMVMEFPDNVLNLDGHQNNGAQLKQFIQRHSMLKQQDLNIAMMVTSREVLSALSQLVPCVGCRRSVERLFSQLVESGNPALEPLTVGPKGVLSVTRSCMTDAKKLYTLFYVHGSKLNDMIDAIPKSKKNKRCQLHSLDTHKPKPLGEGSSSTLSTEKLNADKKSSEDSRKDSKCRITFHYGPFQGAVRGCWMDVWELMSQECRDEVVLIDSSCLLETLETYLRKHRFCTDCKNKVLRAYNILIGELDCSKEKGYCAALYEGLRCCPHERHIHVCCETDFIAHLLGRAEPEFAGGRRERHAKTIDIAQEEVLTCLGIHLYERLHRIWQKLRAEEQTWQMLFYLGVDALRKSFEMAVEKVQGISRLEQLCEEFSEEERVRELKQEKKRQKRKNRRKNKCVCEIPAPLQATEEKEINQAKENSDFMENSCKACGSTEEANSCVEVIVTNESTSCTCPSSGTLLGSPKIKKGLSPHCNGSDCGYSSSMEGSETGSREGSDVACTEGICNHDENGDDSCVHRCDDKEEDGDSCVECWANSEENNTKGKNKKKKKKSKTLKCENDHIQKLGSCIADPGNRETSGNIIHTEFHRDKTKDMHAESCCSSEKSGQQLPWFEHMKNVSQFAEPTEMSLVPDTGKGAKSLVELLDESECTSDEEIFISQDEIQSFMANNKSFYSNREQYRQHLKEKFNKYCRLNDHKRPICNVLSQNIRAIWYLLTWARGENCIPWALLCVWPAQKLAAECQSAGYPGTLIPYKCDLSNEEEILSMFSAIKTLHQGVDVCINNAGLARPEPLLSGKTEGWRTMIDVNVMAVSICTREAYQSMKERNIDDGHIININSMNGHSVVPQSVVHFYSATKYAVTALTEGLRQELREAKTHIRATCISPGLVETGFAFKLHDNDPERAAATYESIRCLKAEDMANAVIYVLSAPPHVQIGDIQMRPTEQIS
ncbi:gametogenetin-binding protein 2 isoform X2 [Struthio camelus]|uniref:gametogenetin-binding protein 2 isoform X2 n=1 Tax=Struthio camelus TaxID=8801 RepID=UPI003603FBBC